MKLLPREEELQPLRPAPVHRRQYAIVWRPQKGDLQYVRGRLGLTVSPVCTDAASCGTRSSGGAHQASSRNNNPIDNKKQRNHPAIHPGRRVCNRHVTVDVSKAGSKEPGSTYPGKRVWHFELKQVMAANRRFTRLETTVERLIAQRQKRSAAFFRKVDQDCDRQLPKMQALTTSSARQAAADTMVWKRKMAQYASVQEICHRAVHGGYTSRKPIC